MEREISLDLPDDEDYRSVVSLTLHYPKTASPDLPASMSASLCRGNSDGPDWEGTTVVRLDCMGETGAVMKIREHYKGHDPGGVRGTSCVDFEVKSKVLHSLARCRSARIFAGRHIFDVPVSARRDLSDFLGMDTHPSELTR